jgi:hypothetical protein
VSFNDGSLRHGYNEKGFPASAGNWRAADGPIIDILSRTCSMDREIPKPWRLSCIFSKKIINMDANVFLLNLGGCTVLAMNGCCSSGEMSHPGRTLCRSSLSLSRSRIAAAMARL